MTFYTDIRKKGNNIFHRGYKDGEQFFEKVKYSPTLFVPTNEPSEWTYFYDGSPMKPMTFETINDAYQTLEKYKNVSNMSLSGMEKFEYQFLVDKYPSEIEYDFNKLRVLNFDIEVDSTDGFPHPQVASETVTAITAEVKNEYYVFGYGEYTPKKDNVHYIKCENEYALLNKFIDFWIKVKPDIVTGWNTDTFDVPYMYNRITNVLGESRAKLLSPWRIAQKKTVYIKNQPSEMIDLFGIEQLDYLNLYRVFTYKKRESYKLDHIASVELGERKLSYEEHQSLSNLYEQDYELYLDYNIKDVELIKNLEEKLGLIKLATTLAYITHVNFTDTFKQVRLWDVFIYYWLYSKKIVLPTLVKNSKEYKYEGAYVKEPVVGKHGWVVSFDINSLYPALIRYLNISPETYVDNTVAGVSVDKFLKEKIDTSIIGDYSIAANGTLYKRTDNALLPNMVRYLYEKRLYHKGQMKSAKKSGDKAEADLHNVYQTVYKTTMNSLYGFLGNEYARMYSTPMAEAITVSGQLVIRWVGKYLNKYLTELTGVEKDYVIYTDTDSVYVNIDDLVQKHLPNESMDKITTFIDKVAEEKLEPIIDQSFQDLGEYLHATEPEALQMKREIIANTAIWQAKKRYAMNVLDNEGTRYEKPNMKIMGMETAKSSTPGVIRDHMKELLYKVLNENEASCQKYIRQTKKKFKEYSIEDIAFPRGVNGLKKYKDQTNLYSKGTPIHVRGSLLYNHYIKKWNLEKKYELISEGEKIKFVFLKEPNPIHENIFAFLQMFPRECELIDYIDYDTMFEKSFLEPMKSIFDAVGWSLKKKKTIESFFE